MKRTLLLNFKGPYNCIELGPLIQGMLNDEPDQTISVMTLQENEPYMKILSHLEHVFYIDRKMIKKVGESRIYPRSLALNSLYDSISGALEIEWDKVINFSNDKTSSYLLPLFNKAEAVGTWIGKDGSVKTNSRWNAYLNYIHGTHNNSFHSIDIKRNLLKITDFVSSGIKENFDYTKVANENFDRARVSFNKPESFIVGVNLSESYSGRALDLDNMTTVLESLMDNPSTLPVLIHGPSTEEVEIVKKLNMSFDNKLLSINMGISTARSVFSGVAVLIGPPNPFMNIAELSGVKLIEVCMEENSKVMSVDHYSIKATELSSYYDDILFCLNNHLDIILPVESMVSRNKIYHVTTDDHCLFESQVRGELNLENELQGHIQRLVHLAILGEENLAESLDILKKQADKKTLDGCREVVRGDLMNVVKLLLSSLRELKQVKDGSGDVHKLIGNVDRILGISKEKSSIAPALSLFESCLENMNQQSLQEGLISIERALFDLKSDLQNVTTILDRFANREDNQRVSHEHPARN